MFIDKKNQHAVTNFL